MAWWAASTAIWGKMGGASAPPDPLDNPLDAVHKQLLADGQMTIATKVSVYRIRQTLHGSWAISYSTEASRLRGYESLNREWHTIDAKVKSCGEEALYALLAAILSEDSFEPVPNIRGQRSVHSMVCGTGIYTLPDERFVVEQE